MIKIKYFYLSLIVFCVLSYSWIIVNFMNYNTSSFSLSICTLKNLSGVPCASCGVTRSVLYFFKGDFFHAMYYNPIGIIVAVLLLILPSTIIHDLVRQKKYLYQIYTSFNINKSFWLLLFFIFIASWSWNLYKYFNHLDF